MIIDPDIDQGIALFSSSCLDSPVIEGKMNIASTDEKLNLTPSYSDKNSAKNSSVLQQSSMHSPDKLNIASEMSSLARHEQYSETTG